jgi:hypothetical protein
MKGNLRGSLLIPLNAMRLDIQGGPKKEIFLFFYSFASFVLLTFALNYGKR